MAMLKAFHPRDHVDDIYGIRKEGGRDLTNFEDCRDQAIQELKKNINKCKQRLSIADNNNNSKKKKKNRKI